MMITWKPQHAEIESKGQRMFRENGFMQGAPERQFSYGKRPKKGESATDIIHAAGGKTFSEEQSEKNRVAAAITQTEAGNKESNRELDKEIAAQKLEEGARLMMEGRDGAQHEAVVLEVSEDGSAEVVYNAGKEFPELVVMKKGPESQEARETAPEANVGEKLEAMEDVNESAFEKAAKSKWSLAGAAERLTKAIKESEAVSFAKDFKDMLVGNEAETVDLGEGETAEQIGQRSVFGAGMEMIWGAPKDIIRAVGSAAAEVGNAAESEMGRMKLAEASEFAKKMADFETLGEQRGFLAKAKEALTSPFDIMKGVSRHIQGEMVLPVIKGNMDMIKFVQEKITGDSQEPSFDLSDEYESLESLNESLGDDWEAIQEEFSDATDTFDSAVTERRMSKLDELLASEDQIMKDARGMSLTDRRNALRQIRKEIMDLESGKSELDELKEELLAAK